MEPPSTSKHLYYLVGIVVMSLLVLFHDNLNTEQQQTRSEKPAQRQRTTGERVIANSITAHWDDISRISAYVVQFDGINFISRYVPISAVAATPEDFNLVASDYRCGYCKADRKNVETLIRTHPHQNFVFMESAILGEESIKLAERVISEAHFNPQGYYAI